MIKHILKVIFPAAVIIIMVTSAFALYNNQDGELPDIPFISDLSEQLALPDPLSGSLNILVLGVNGDDYLTDVVMLARIDGEANKAALIQLPRDLYVGESGGKTGKLNSVFGWRSDTEQGVSAVKKVISNQLGVNVDYYILVDMETIKEAVDDIGGVEVDVPLHITYLPGKELLPGVQRLSGEQAEWLIRTRSTYKDGDIGRMRAQALFLKGALGAIKEQKLSQLAAFAIKYRDKVSTDMPSDVVLSIIPVAMGLSEETITMLSVPLYRFVRYDKYDVFVANRTKLAELLSEYFLVDKSKVMTSWGPPEPESEQEQEDMWSGIFDRPDWEAVVGG